MTLTVLNVLKFLFAIADYFRNNTEGINVCWGGGDGIQNFLTSHSYVHTVTTGTETAKSDV